MRAGTLTMRRRRVAPAGDGEGAVGEGGGGAEQVVGHRCADGPGVVGGEPSRGQVDQGPSMRSAKTVSMIAVPAVGQVPPSVTGRSLLVRNGWCRQTGTIRRASCWSRTPCAPHPSHGVSVVADAVNVVSATSASEINSAVSGSVTAADSHRPSGRPGDRRDRPVTAAFLSLVTANCAPALTQSGGDGPVPYAEIAADQDLPIRPAARTV